MIRMILETAIATISSTSRFICVMDAQSVLCEVGTGVTNTINLSSLAVTVCTTSFNFPQF
jgi:hypothetical protein